jgi:Fe-S cluster assembly iron-binding protein IscA
VLVGVLALRAAVIVRTGMNWVDMTDTAYEKVVGFLRDVAEPDRQAMWLEVTGTSGNRWNCSLALKPLDAAAPRDVVLRHRDLPIVIRARDFRKVRGATIDWLDKPSGASGLTVDNPNTPSPVLGGPPPADLSGDRTLMACSRRVRDRLRRRGAAKWQARSRVLANAPAEARCHSAAVPGAAPGRRPLHRRHGRRQE